MTISSDLFLAILSIDSYNRGYGAGIGGAQSGLGETGQIGTSTLLTLADIGVSNSTYQSWQDAGFYAVAYQLTAAVGDLAAGTTIFAHRGTDAPASWYFGVDLPFHSGDYDEVEPSLALQFRSATVLKELHV